MTHQDTVWAGSTLVLGMGSTGASCARHLAAQGGGTGLIFADSRAAPPGLAAIQAAAPGSTLLCGEIPAALPAGVGRVILSPGVALDLPLLDEARARGVTLESDIDLFVAGANAPILAVTGSNGKSTVTSMVAAMLSAAGVRAVAGGNLGTPALDLLDDGVEAYVLELSSFQLERSRPVPSAAAVLLNISDDHLDVHGTLDRYTQAKARVYAACQLAVVNRDVPGLAGLVPPGVPAVSFGLGVAGDRDFGLRVDPDGLWLARGWDVLMPVEDMPLAGRHNLANALAALALCTALGLKPEALVAGLRQYQPLPHRMAVVATADDITWVDDSKATNVGAAVASIMGVEGPLVLIAGGDAKGAGFEPLAAALAGRECHVLLLGRDRERLATALGSVAPVEVVADMDEAVARARQVAQPGWTVLLAPACSSLDMYRDYAARGEAFCQAVRRTAGAVA